MDSTSVPLARLRRMGLASPVHAGPEDVVRHHLAMQSQDFGPAKWAIAQRLDRVADSDIERLISEGSILRTHVLRPTWHLVAGVDLRWLMALSGPRVQRTVASRYLQLGLDAETRTRAERAIAKALSGGNHLTRPELAVVLTKARIEIEGQRLPHLLSHCELESVICSGRVRGAHQTYALFDERVAAGSDLGRDAALEELVRRYLGSHGPATVRDLSWWSGLSAADVRQGLAEAGAVPDEAGGMTLWQLGEAGRRRPRSPERRCLLLQSYDEYVVGYTQSRYVGDPRADKVRAAFRDRSLPAATVMLGSHVAGHWRRAVKGGTVVVEVVLYAPLPRADAHALEEAADELGVFLGKTARLDVRMM